MKDFHGTYDCKTEKKTLPIPPIGFSMKASRYRDVINHFDRKHTHDKHTTEANNKRILNRLRNWNRIPFRSLLVLIVETIEILDIPLEFKVYLLISSGFP